MEQLTRCTCGNKFLVLMSHLSQDAAMVAEPCDPPTAYCPGCGGIWQHQDDKVWRKVVGVTTLQSLRQLSNG